MKTTSPVLPIKTVAFKPIPNAESPNTDQQSEEESKLEGNPQRYGK